MKLLILTITLAASAIASPVTSEQAAARAEPAQKFISNQDEFGQYDFEYITAEGIIFKQRGKLVPTADGKHVIEIEGEVSYIGDDGKVYATKYSAGIEGTKMEGSHLPIAPELPIVAEIHEADTVVPEAASTETAKTDSEAPVEAVVPFEPAIATDAPSEKISEVEPVLAEEKANEEPITNAPEEKRDVGLIGDSESEIVVPVLPNELQEPISVVHVSETEPELYLPASEITVPEREVLTLPDGPIHITQVHIPKSMMRFPAMLQVVPLFLQQLNQ